MSHAPPIESDAAADDGRHSNRIGIEKPFVRRPSPNRETLS